MPDPRKGTQLCHVPQGEAVPVSPAPARPACSVGRVSMVYPPQSVAAGVEDGLSESDTVVQQGRLKNSESLNNLHVLLGHLSESQQADLSEVIKSFPCLFDDTPTQTPVTEHDIDVGDGQPIRQRFYRVNPEKNKYLNTEVKYMVPPLLVGPPRAF